MARKKGLAQSPGNGYTWGELYDKIDYEGFDYFFVHYTNPAKFTEPKLRELALKFVEAYHELDNYIKVRVP